MQTIIVVGALQHIDQWRWHEVSDRNNQTSKYTLFLSLLHSILLWFNVEIRRRAVQCWLIGAPVTGAVTRRFVHASSLRLLSLIVSRHVAPTRHWSILWNTSIASIVNYTNTRRQHITAFQYKTIQLFKLEHWGKTNITVSHLVEE